MDHRPTGPVVLGQLLDLLGARFDRSALLDRVLASGWGWTPEPDDEDGFRVSVPGCHPLLVLPRGTGILGVSLPLVWWEEPDDGRRAAFDRLFDAHLAALELRLGPHGWSHTDDDAQTYRAAAWARDEGLVLLYQSAMDPQFGHQLELALLPGSVADLPTGGILVDWLLARWS